MTERKTDQTEGEVQPESRPFPEMRFDLGDIVVTAGAHFTLQRLNRHPIQLVARHVEGDWGDLDEHDIRENEQSADQGFRVVSAYNIDDAKFYVITEWDRSYTTVLLPEEY